MDRTVSNKKTIFAAFKHYNYRLWFAGQAVSLLGSWMQMVAQGFYVYELTKNAAFLGLVTFASGLPTIVLSLFGGVVADRISKRDLMVITQTVMMVLAFILSTLAFTGLATPWIIIVLAFFLGVANAFDAPARMAFAIEMVGKEDLGNAIAMNSMMFNLGTAIGPAVSGIVYAAFGPGWCFFINGISYIFIIIALLMMRLPKHVKPINTGSSVSDIVAGLKYTFAHETIRMLIIGVAVVTIFAFSFMTLLPAWPEKVLGTIGTDQSSLVNGFLQSARGVGALLAALTAAALGAAKIQGKMLFWSQLLAPVLLIAFSLTGLLPLSLAFLFFGGYFLMLLYNTSNIIIQLHVEDCYRGRVMGIYSLAFMGIMPIGGLLAGAVAQLLTPQLTVLISSAICLAIMVALHMISPKLKHLQ